MKSNRTRTDRIPRAGRRGKQPDASPLAAEHDALLRGLHLAPIGIVQFDRSGSIELRNPRAAQILASLDGTGRLDNLLHALAPFAPLLLVRFEAFEGPWGVISDGQRVPVTGPEGGDPVVLSVTLLKLDEERFMALLGDATTLVAQERQLLQLATQDELTGLTNRRHFFEIGELEIERWRRYHPSLSLITLDVDGLRNINDVYGQGVGDLVLKTVAEACRKQVRKVDVLARLGGEELVVLTPSTDLAGAAILAERIRKAVETAEVNAAGSPVKFTVSLGVATMEGELQVLEELIVEADRALAQAKAWGRNRVALAPGVQQQRLRRPQRARAPLPPASTKKIPPPRRTVSPVKPTA